MKKTIIIALTLILVLASFISCENNTHEHTWDKGTVTKAATCTEKGVKTYTCTVCKETKTEDIAINPENHTWNEGEVITPATCTVSGEKTFTCTGCNKTKTEAIEALGHNFKGEENVEVKPTYLKQGILKTSCTRCTATIDSDIPCIPISGQAFAYAEDQGSNTGVTVISIEEKTITQFKGIIIDDGLVKATSYGTTQYLIKPVEKGNSIEYELSLYSDDILLQTFSISENTDEEGNVVSILMVYKENEEIQGADTIIPVIIDYNAPKKEADGHYYPVNSPVDLLKTTVSTNITETATEIVMETSDVTVKSLSIGPFDHVGEYEITTPLGYFTPGTYSWDKCDICGYNEDTTNVLLPLANTKWISEGSDFDGKQRVFEFGNIFGKVYSLQESDLTEIATIYFSRNLGADNLFYLSINDISNPKNQYGGKASDRTDGNIIINGKVFKPYK